MKPRMAHYAAAATRIRAVFEEFTPLVEPLSLDEAFLDVTGSLQLFGNAKRLAERLRERIRVATGLTVSVGIAPTKMVAKIASAMCKPDGVLEVAADRVDDFLRPLPVHHLWGVGPTTQAGLIRLGLTTIGALADADPVFLERRLGSAGLALRHLARGDDSRVVDPERQRRSYGEEATFAGDLRDGPTIRRTIAAHAEAVARRLRAGDCRGRTVTLKFKLAQRIGPGKYPILTRRVTLPSAVDDGKVIADTALALWDAAKAGTVVRLVGVSVSGIEDTERLQLSLFAAPESRSRALNRAVDTLAARFGSDVVTRGSVARPRARQDQSGGRR